MQYTDKQRAEFLEVAKEIGITRAKRQLKYPSSHNTAREWVKAAGIEIPLDEIKAQAAAHNDWYKTEDLLVVIQEGLLRAQEALENSADLTPDDQKKLSEAIQKYTNTWLLLQGKANNISERRTTDVFDVELLSLFGDEETRNKDIENKEDVSY